MSRKYTIIFRACDIVNAVNKNPRPFDLPKPELIKICFQSLIDSLQGVDHKIIVLGDKLSDDMVLFFKSFKVELILGSYGNDASIRETFKIAGALQDDEWVYFCEDDYLHQANSFQVIDNFLNERNEIFKRKVRPYNLSTFRNLAKHDLFIHPADNPYQYLSRYRKPAIIVASKDCHWRQIPSVTFTFLTKASSVKKYMSIFMECSHKANDRRMSRKIFGRFSLFTKAICFTPLPGLSSHMHRDIMSPFVNWEKLVESYQDKMKYSVLQ
jgi:hypothetical protein